MLSDLLEPFTDAWLFEDERFSLKVVGAAGVITAALVGVVILMAAPSLRLLAVLTAPSAVAAIVLLVATDVRSTALLAGLVQVAVACVGTLWCVRYAAGHVDMFTTNVGIAVGLTAWPVQRCLSTLAFHRRVAVESIASAERARELLQLPRQSDVVVRLGDSAAEPDILRDVDGEHPVDIAKAALGSFSERRFTAWYLLRDVQSKTGKPDAYRGSSKVTITEASTIDFLGSDPANAFSAFVWWLFPGITLAVVEGVTLVAAYLLATYLTAR